ncbi:MAG: hypothetical protein VZS44_06635 [Bacilli bacterium]|nr:hypothetical protein [Bacilli bacterium]
MLSNMEKKRVVFSRALRIWGDIISRYYVNDSIKYECGLELIKRSYLLLGNNGLKLLTPSFAEECRNIRHKVFESYPSPDASKYTYYDNVLSHYFSGSMYNIEQAIINGIEIGDHDICAINSIWMPVNSFKNDFKYPNDIVDEEELGDLMNQFYSSDKCLSIDLDKDAYAINFDINKDKINDIINLIQKIITDGVETISYKDAFNIADFAVKLQYLLEREEIFQTKHSFLDIELLYKQCINILMNQNKVNLKSHIEIVKSPIYNKYFGNNADNIRRKNNSIK